MRVTGLQQSTGQGGTFVLGGRPGAGGDTAQQAASRQAGDSRQGNITDHRRRLGISGIARKNRIE